MGDLATCKVDCGGKTAFFFFYPRLLFSLFVFLASFLFSTFYIPSVCPIIFCPLRRFYNSFFVCCSFLLDPLVRITFVYAN